MPDYLLHTGLNISIHVTKLKKKDISSVHSTLKYRENITTDTGKAGKQTCLIQDQEG